MNSKDRVKEEIDQMPEELIEKVYQFITDIKKEQKEKRKLPSFNLNGIFDHTDIRKSAYE